MRRRWIELGTATAAFAVLLAGGGAVLGAPPTVPSKAWVVSARLSTGAVPGMGSRALVSAVAVSGTNGLAVVPSTLNVSEARRADRDALPDPPAERPAAPPEPPPPSLRPTVPAH